MNELLIYSDIGDSFWGDSVTAQSVKAELDRMDPGDLTVRINSPGGSVFDGFTIYNLLSQRDGNITVYIDGLAASAASVVAMAGDQIVMAENAMMMIHDPWTMTVGSADEMRETADLLDKIKTSIVSTYQRKTGLDGDEIGGMMEAETWFNAADAVSKGFATATVEGGQTVSNLCKPWIQNAPKPELVAESIEDQTAWRVSLSRRRLELIEQN